MLYGVAVVAAAFVFVVACVLSFDRKDGAPRMLPRFVMVLAVLIILMGCAAIVRAGI